LIAAAAGSFFQVRHPVAMAVLSLAALAVSALLMPAFDIAWKRRLWPNWWQTLAHVRTGRRKWAAYCIHLGFVCVAVGVTGSSLGTERQEMTLSEGDAIEWAGRRIHYVRLEQREAPDKLIAEAVLHVGGSTPVELRPARHLHLLQNEWTTEVAIQSSWRGDLYTILNAGLGEGRIAITLVSNPLMRWIWVGGLITTVSAVVSLWPSRRRGVRADTAVRAREGDRDEQDGKVARRAA
jgi:cytochrome c biogenesis factor